MRLVFLAFGFAAGVAASPFAEGAKDTIDTMLAPLTPTAVAMPVCAPVVVNIYFERGESGLSSSAFSSLGAMSDRVKGCAIASVSIENQPESVATEEGRRIAGLRGAAVLKNLSARGLAPEAVVIAESDSEEPAGAVAPEHVRVSITPASGAITRTVKVPDNEI